MTLSEKLEELVTRYAKYGNATGEDELALFVLQNSPTILQALKAGEWRDVPPSGYALVPREITEAQADCIGMPRAYFERAIRILAPLPTPPSEKSHE